MTNNYEFKSYTQNPFVITKAHQIIMKTWPKYFFNSVSFKKYWYFPFIKFFNYQFCLINKSNNDIIGICNTMPLNWGKSLMELPDTGWDWAVEKAYLDFKAKSKPNYLCLLSIIINNKYKNYGFTDIILEQIIKKAKELNLIGIISPIRPTLKHNYTDITMKEYISWKKSNDEYYDPWINSHVKNGAKIIKICNKSTTIAAKVSKWKKWTGMDIKTSGKNYVPPIGLNPLKVYLDKDLIIYREPNIWVHYQI